MIDSDLERAIKSVLDTGLASQSISAIVTQSYQPTKQGAPLDPVVIFTKIAARRYGFQGRKLTLIPGDPNTFQQVEPYYLRATYQVSGFMTRDPLDSNSLSAYDVIDKCAAILQSEVARGTLKAAGFGIDRISDIRTPHSLDDSDRFVMDASFDFVLSYLNELTSIVPEATIEGTVERV